MKILNNITAGCLLLVSLTAVAQERPDFSGTWMPDRSPGSNKGFPRSGWNYTEYGQQLQDAFTAEFDPDKDESSFFCVQPGMPMTMAQAPPFPLEVIQRDHDITLFFEAWSQYRKIYIDGYQHPEPILASRMGYSLGKWEGDTLVIEGNFLSERTMGRSLMSEEATFVERLHMETGADGKRRLISDIVFTDPVIYAEPIEMRGTWIDSPETPIMEYSCADELYEDHLERVRQSRE
jgi:hypothetical protein